MQSTFAGGYTATTNVMQSRATSVRRLFLDFIHDRLFNGRAFRGLTMMDEFSRCGLALELNYSFPSKSVIDVLDEVART